MKLICSKKISDRMTKESDLANTVKDKLRDVKDQWAIGEYLARKSQEQENKTNWRDKLHSNTLPPEEYPQQKRYKDYPYMPGLRDILQGIERSSGNRVFTRNPFAKGRRGVWKTTNKAHADMSISERVSDFLSTMEDKKDWEITQEEKGKLKNLQDLGFIEWKDNDSSVPNNQTNQQQPTKAVANPQAKK